MYDLLQLIYRAGGGALEGSEGDILSYPNAHILQGFIHSAVCHFGIVVLEREVAEPDIMYIGIIVPRQECRAGLVALVSARREDTLFEIRRIRSVEQHALIMVGLDHQMVGRSDKLLHGGVRLAAVGDDDKALTQIVNRIAYAVGRIVRYAEGLDLHALQLPYRSFLKKASAGLELLSDAIVAIDTGMDLRRGVDRQMDPLAQRTYRADMVGMVVGDEHSIYITVVEAHLAKVFLDGTRRYRLRTEVVTIATTTTRKTPEYESLFLHNAKIGHKSTKKFAYIQKKVYFCCVKPKKLDSYEKNSIFRTVGDDDRLGHEFVR